MQRALLCGLLVALGACVADAGVGDEVELIGISEGPRFDAPEVMDELLAMAPWEEADRLSEEHGVPFAPVRTALGMQAMAYAEVDGMAVVDDVVLGTLEDVADARERGAGLTNVWFEDGNIRWRSLRAADSPVIRQAFGYLNAHTPLQLTEVGAGAGPDLRLQRSGLGAVTGGGSTPGYWNAGGQRILFHGAPAVNTVLHEMGHALGMPHEFQRADRPALVGFAGCIGSDFWVGVGGLANPTRNLSPYDLSSVMTMGFHASTLEETTSSRAVRREDSPSWRRVRAKL